MNEKTKQGNQALQVLNKSELLGRQFTVYGTAENPLFLAKEERIKLKKARIQFQYDIVRRTSNVEVE